MLRWPLPPDPLPTAHQTPFIPAKAGIQGHKRVHARLRRAMALGPRFRGDERKRVLVRKDAQSADTPLALIGPLQRAISPATNLVKYSGLLRSAGAISSPRASKRSRTYGVSSASPMA